METHWVGTVSTSNLSKEDQVGGFEEDLSLLLGLPSHHSYIYTFQVAIKAILEPLNCHPIFIPPELIEGHYHGYCKKVGLDETVVRLKTSTMVIFLFFFTWSGTVAPFP